MWHVIIANNNIFSLEETTHPQSLFLSPLVFSIISKSSFFYSLCISEIIYSFIFMSQIRKNPRGWFGRYVLSWIAFSAEIFQTFFSLRFRKLSCIFLSFSLIFFGPAKMRSTMEVSTFSEEFWRSNYCLFFSFCFN